MLGGAAREGVDQLAKEGSRSVRCKYATGDGGTDGRDDGDAGCGHGREEAEGDRYGVYGAAVGYGAVAAGAAADGGECSCSARLACGYRCGAASEEAETGGAGSCGGGGAEDEGSSSCEGN